MTTNAIRGAILVGAVIVGALVIANAFPTAASGPIPLTSPSSSPSAHPTPSPKKTHVKLDCGAVTGTQVAVENAHTATNGLAAAVAAKLSSVGYRINPGDIKNAPADQATTSVFFASSADRIAARCLRKKYFVGAKLGRLPSDAGVSSAVQVTVYLGADYAAKHPVG